MAVRFSAIRLATIFGTLQSSFWRSLAWFSQVDRCWFQMKHRFSTSWLQPYTQRLLRFAPALQSPGCSSRLSFEPATLTWLSFPQSQTNSYSWPTSSTTNCTSADWSARANCLRTLTGLCLSSAWTGQCRMTTCWSRSPAWWWCLGSCPGRCRPKRALGSVSSFWLSWICWWDAAQYFLSCYSQKPSTETALSCCSCLHSLWEVHWSDSCFPSRPTRTAA